MIRNQTERTKTLASASMPVDISKSSSQRSGISSLDEYTTSLMPACINDLAQREHGGQVTYAVLSLRETPILAACIMAFSSA